MAAIGIAYGQRMQRANQVLVDVAKTASVYWDVLQRCLDVAVDLRPLAVQAGLCLGCEVCGETFPNIPGGG
jgi:hypothetical protein